MNYLTEIYNDPEAILSGQKVDAFGSGNANKVNETLAEYKKATGKEPAVLSLDVYGRNYGTLTEAERVTVAEQLVAYAKRGGIITISSHLFNLNDPNWPTEWKGELGGPDKWAETVTEGTALNNELKRQLGYAIDLLKRLQKADVPVLWRPYHEMTSGFFWWGTYYLNENGEEALLPASCYQNLWKWTHRYMTDTMGLDNLLWVYSPTPRNNIPNQMDGGVMYCYPGNDYVDIVGLDCYFNTTDETSNTQTFGRGQVDVAIASLETTGKIFALCEFGYSGGKVSEQSSVNLGKILNYMMMTKQYKIAYFLNWAGSEPYKMTDKGASLYGNRMVLFLENSAKRQGIS